MINLILAQACFSMILFIFVLMFMHAYLLYIFICINNCYVLA